MNDKEVLVKVENVSKKFSYDLKTSLKYGAIDIAKSTLGLKSSDELRPKEFWAGKDISFELKRGECIGLIGHNGAGKSTLLKVLNGLYAPDKGKITMKGKVGALIELGAGFNPILTGRENIYNNAAVLGFTRDEVNAKMRSIIDFSEIEDFMDTPVKNYSSGMKVRLGFAIAAHMEPDILIIDEVLAVGDLAFRLKCFKKIDEISKDTAIIFVTHNMSQISRMCNRIVLMDHGNVIFQGDDVSKGIELYYGKNKSNNQSVVFDSNEVALESFKLVSHPSIDVNRNDTVVFDIVVKILSNKITETPIIDMSIFDKEDRSVAVIDNKFIKRKKIENNRAEYRVEIPNIQLSKGNYFVNLAVSNDFRFDPLLKVQYLQQLNILDDREVWPAFLLNANWDSK